jgi:transposase
MDVHKKSIVACLMVGKKKEIRTFGTMTADIMVMSEWLSENDCEAIAMESTGVYWKPIYNVLELLGWDLIVANARHIKTVPGRKTDVKDAEWIAKLVKHGLINPSFIQERDQRETKEMVRYRKSLVEERSREMNRLEKVLEGANIKLSSVVSELTGMSSRNILHGLVDETLNKGTIGDMVHVSMRGKIDELLRACEGILSKTQKVLIKAMLAHIDDMTKRIGDMDDFLNGKLKEYDETLKKLQKLPGIGVRSAQVIISEIGIDMSRFPSDKHIASWVGLCPGNNESAGKKASGKTGKGNKALKTTLIQCAQVASKNKDSFFKAQYDRLVVRRGAKRAKVAVAHSMLIAIYHMLKDGTEFNDLGVDYYIQFNPEKKINYHLGKLEKLGWTPPIGATA